MAGKITGCNNPHFDYSIGSCTNRVVPFKKFVQFSGLFGLVQSMTIFTSSMLFIYYYYNVPNYLEHGVWHTFTQTYLNRGRRISTILCNCMYFYIFLSITWMYSTIYLMKKIRECKSGSVNPSTMIFFDRTFVSKYACIIWSITTLFVCFYDLIVIKFIYDDVQSRLNDPYGKESLLLPGLQKIPYRTGYVIKFTKDQEIATMLMFGFCLQFGILWFVNIICAGIVCFIPFMNVRFNEADKVMKCTQTDPRR